MNGKKLKEETLFVVEELWLLVVGIGERIEVIICDWIKVNHNSLTGIKLLLIILIMPKRA